MNMSQQARKKSSNRHSFDLRDRRGRKRPFGKVCEGWRPENQRKVAPIVGEDEPMRRLANWVKPDPRRSWAIFSTSLQDTCQIWWVARFYGVFRWFMRKAVVLMTAHVTSHGGVCSALVVRMVVFYAILLSHEWFFIFWQLFAVYFLGTI